MEFDELFFTFFQFYCVIKKIIIIFTAEMSITR